jgi:hypothetical protein
MMDSSRVLGWTCVASTVACAYGVEGRDRVSTSQCAYGYMSEGPALSPKVLACNAIEWNDTIGQGDILWAGEP